MRLLSRLLLAGAALVALAPSAPAAEPIKGVDLLSSTVFQKGQSSFSGLGGRVRMTSARLVPGVEILPVIEYWRNKSTVSGFGIATSRRDATIGADVRYTFRQAGWSPYIGGGYGIHFLSTEVDAPTLGLDHREDSLVKGGLALIGGVNFPLTSRIENIVDVKYHHLSDYRQLKFSWGLAWNL